MKSLLSACLYALTACSTPLDPTHSRERIFNLGIVSWVERIDAQQQAQTVQYAAPPVPTSPTLYK